MSRCGIKISAHTRLLVYRLRLPLVILVSLQALFKTFQNKERLDHHWSFFDMTHLKSTQL